MMMQLEYKSSHSCWSRKYKQSVCQPPGYRGMKGGSHRGRKEWMLCFIRVFPRVFHKCVFVCVRKRERDRENLQTLKKPPSLNWHLCVFWNVLKGLGGGQWWYCIYFNRYIFLWCFLKGVRGIQKTGAQPLITTLHQQVLRHRLNHIMGNKSLFFLSPAEQVLTQGWSGCVSLQRALPSSSRCKSLRVKVPTTCQTLMWTAGCQGCNMECDRHVKETWRYEGGLRRMMWQF